MAPHAFHPFFWDMTGQQMQDYMNQLQEDIKEEGICYFCRAGVDPDCLHITGQMGMRYKSYHMTCLLRQVKFCMKFYNDFYVKETPSVPESVCGYHI